MLTNLREREVVLIDGGSTSLFSSLPNVTVIDADAPPPRGPSTRHILFRFGSHLGRRSVFSFPGWWRSFTYSAQIALKYPFGKMIRIESGRFYIERQDVGSRSFSK